MNRRQFAKHALGGLAAAAAVSILSKPASAAAGQVHQLHCILRPNALGQWYIQSDATHAPYGIDLFVQQTSNYLRIYTSGRVYTKAGAIQISSDDGFGAYQVTGHANLGLNTAIIQVRVAGHMIDPSRICTFAPNCGSDGNFWINLTMIE